MHVPMAYLIGAERVNRHLSRVDLVLRHVRVVVVAIGADSVLDGEGQKAFGVDSLQHGAGIHVPEVLSRGLAGLGDEKVVIDIAIGTFADVLSQAPPSAGYPCPPFFHLPDDLKDRLRRQRLGVSVVMDDIVGALCRGAIRPLPAIDLSTAQLRLRLEGEVGSGHDTVDVELLRRGIDSGWLQQTPMNASFCKRHRFLMMLTFSATSSTCR